MKKVLMLILLCVMVFSTFACGDREKDISPITKEEISVLYTEPGDFYGRMYEFTAQILTVEKADGVLYIQSYHDIVNYEENTVIVYEGDDISVVADDYINVVGTVIGEFKRENIFGGVIKAPQIQAEKLEKITAVEAFSADRTVDVNETVTKGKYKATL